MRALVIAVFLIGRGDGDGDGDGDVPASVEEYATEFAERICALQDSCCVDSGGAVMSDCVGELTAGRLDTHAEAVADGAAFNPQAAAACLAFISDLTCDFDLLALRGLNRSCDVWDGTIPEGGACRTGVACERPDDISGVGCVNGECAYQLLSPVGGACAEAGLDCDPLVAECEIPGGETIGECVALPAAGEMCTGSCELGADCDDNDLCVALGRAGDACQVDNDCAGDVCSGGRCAGFQFDDYCTLPD